LFNTSNILISGSRSFLRKSLGKGNGLTLCDPEFFRTSRLVKKNSGYRAISTLRGHIDKIVKEVSAKNLFPEVPTLHFCPENIACSDQLNVFKTREKKVVTLDIGAFRAKEIILQHPKIKSFILLMS